MATVSSLFFIACALSLLVGQVSYGHKLLNFSNEDERASCPNTNCQGKASCTKDADCTPNQCCIDLQLSQACCYAPGNPTRAPSSATTTTAPTPAPLQYPSCEGYYVIPDCDPCECIHTDPDCYPGEVCCLKLTPAPAALMCRSTTPPPGAACPIKTPALKCNPDAPAGNCVVPGVGGAADTSNCRSNEICCKVTRASTTACCVVV